MIIDLKESVVEAVRDMLRIAHSTLEEQGTHLPTAILHTIDRMIPIVMPFEDDSQRATLVEQVRKQAALHHAHAVTTVTSAQIVDSRTGEKQHCLVAATAMQGGRPYVVMQYFSKNEDTGVIEFGEEIEGEDAEMPGQMMIIPEWEAETCH